MDLSGLTDAQIDALIQAEQDQEEKHEMEKQISPTSVLFEVEELEAPSCKLPYQRAADSFTTKNVGGRCNTANQGNFKTKNQKPKTAAETPILHPYLFNVFQTKVRFSESKVKPSSELNNSAYHQVYKN